MSTESGGVRSGDEAAASAEGGAAAIGNLPDPMASLRSLGTDYPLPQDFDVNAFYKDDETNGWYPLLEKYVETIMDECEKYSAKHEESSKLYNRRYQYITIFLIIIPLLIGIIALLPLPSVLKNIIQGILGLIGTALGSFNKVMKFQERASLHRLSRDKFMKLNGTIAEQLFLPDSKRFNGVMFERWARTVFFTVKELAPYPERRRKLFWPLSYFVKSIPPNGVTGTVPMMPIPPSGPPPTVPPPLEGEPLPEQPTGTPDENAEATQIARYRKYLLRERRAIFRADPS